MDLTNQELQPKSVDDAAAGLMADLDVIVGDAEPVPTPPRGDDGKFKAAEPAETVEETAETGEPPEAKKAEPPAQEDDGDYFEIEETGDDGKPVVVRHKAAEVWEGFRKAKELEQEVVKARAAQPMPDEIETALSQIVQERTKYLQALSEWEVYNQPKMPPREMRDPNHPNYNPEEYVRLVGEYERTEATRAQVKAERDRVQSINDQETKALAQARHQRERAKLLEVWPELKDKAAAEKLLADLGSHYGLDAAVVNSVGDHRFYKLAKDALAFRNAQTAKQEAVKVVRGKPKLVRATATTPQNTQQAKVDSGLARLTKSGSAEDAAALLAALL